MSGRKKTIIITGGNGFVGRHLINELKREWVGCRIIVWDQPEVDIIKPSDYRQSLQKTKPDWIVHLAAISSVLVAIEKPDLAKRVNTEATRQLLEEAASLSPRTKFFVTSTSDIYGAMGLSTPLLPELALSKAKPANPYAQSKWEMEKMIEDRYSDRVLRVRPFPHIGPGQGLGFVTADFACQIARIEKSEQEPIMKVGNLKSKRDFTDVRDVVRAYRLLMECGKLGEVYNVASGRAVSIKTILDDLLALSKVDISVERDLNRMRPADVPVMVGDASKLREETGWQPAISLSQSLQDIMDYWRAQ